MTNDIEILFIFETNNVEQVELCVKALMKQSQYRKYKEIHNEINKNKIGGKKILLIHNYIY